MDPLRAAQPDLENLPSSPRRSSAAAFGPQPEAGRHDVARSALGAGPAGGPAAPQPDLANPVLAGPGDVRSSASGTAAGTEPEAEVPDPSQARPALDSIVPAPEGLVPEMDIADALAIAAGPVDSTGPEDVGATPESSSGETAFATSESDERFGTRTLPTLTPTRETNGPPPRTPPVVGGEGQGPLPEPAGTPASGAVQVLEGAGTSPTLDLQTTAPSEAADDFDS